MHSAEIQRKLKKTQKALPPFGWDTEPVIGAEEMVEEAFVDVFCDLIYGGGWMDTERCEETDRECNWALVSMPFSHSSVVFFLLFYFVVVRFLNVVGLNICAFCVCGFRWSSSRCLWEGRQRLKARPTLEHRRR